MELDKLKTQIGKLAESLGLTSLDNNPQLQFIPEHLKVQPSFAILSAAILLLLFLVLILTDSAIIMIVGFLVPSFYSHQALNSQNESDDRKWLIYWIVFILSQVFVGPILHVLLSSSALNFLKIILILFLVSQYTKGYDLVYQLINSFMKKHNQSVQNIIEQGKNKLNQMTNNIRPTVAQQFFK